MRRYLQSSEGAQLLKRLPEPLSSHGPAPVGKKQKGDCLPLSRSGLNCSTYFLIFSAARRFIGTIRSLDPLPKTLRNPASKLRSLILLDMTSLTLSPDEYISSSIAESRTKVSLFTSVSNKVFISSILNAFGSLSHCFGLLRVSVGSSKMIFSVMRYRENP